MSFIASALGISAATLGFSALGVAAVGAGVAGVSAFSAQQNIEKKKWQSLEDKAQGKTDAMMAEGKALTEQVKGKTKRRKRSKTILTGALNPEQILGTAAPSLTGGTRPKTTIG